MSDFTKIVYYDLRLEERRRMLPDVIGRAEELQRLTRVLDRRLNNNALVVGPPGCGKTTFVRGAAKLLLPRPPYRGAQFVEFDVESFYALQNPANTFLPRYQEALETLPSGVVFMDNFGAFVHNRPALLQALVRLLTPLLENPKTRVVLSATTQEMKWLESEAAAWCNWFEILPLKTQPAAEQLQILKSALHRLDRATAITAGDEVLAAMIKYVERFPVLGQLPAAGIRLLDETMALARGLGQHALAESQVQLVVAGKTGIPTSQLQTNELALLKNLEADLNQKIISQDRAIKKIATTIQRAKLGLRSPNRPLGSFLVLGPSGVGKTETAKLLAQKIFGKKESFIRLDMSEFGQEHTVQRLVGAPPGYVGYEEGGGLTNAVKNEPYSLILLDEIEKAHAKVFDIFLQLLDDGRLTSGQGETVDFSQTIIMATSNLAVPEILRGFQAGAPIFSDEFLRDQIIPALTRAFRLEFLNRFDSIVIFKPLAAADLVRIAELEIQAIEQRVSKYKIKFAIDPRLLAGQIQRFADPRFGARPVKRYVEEICETLITKALLK